MPLQEIGGPDRPELRQAPKANAQELGQELKAFKICTMDQLLVRSHHLGVSKTVIFLREEAPSESVYPVAES